MNNWAEIDKARFLHAFAEAWPESSLARARDANSELRRVWLYELERYPCDVALEALGEIVSTQEYHKAPTPVQVKARVADIMRALLAMKAREAKAMAIKDGVSPEEFAADEAYWEPRVNSRDPKKAAWWRRQRDRLSHGLFPEVLGRVPGAEG
jgi:hypothetical protein